MLCNELMKHNMTGDRMDVQTNWNKMEEILTKVSDIVAPISEFTDNVSSKSQIIPPSCQLIVILFCTLIVFKRCFIKYKPPFKNNLEKLFYVVKRNCGLNKNPQKKSFTSLGFKMLKSFLRQ